MVGKAPSLLGVDSSVWQTALAVMQLCGMTEKQAMQAASNNSGVLRFNWLAVPPLANRLALQRCLQLTAGQVYERHAWYTVGCSDKRLTGRVLFLQQHSLPHLLVAKKPEALQQWRRQHGFRANRRASGEPPLISLSNVCTLSDTEFVSLPAAQAADGLPALRAFAAGLESNPAWRELQAEAAAEQSRLLELLPPGLREKAEKRRQAAGQSQAGQEEEE